jgi:hypothetical protein
VFQLNKRDLRDLVSEEDLAGDLRTAWCTHVASVATKMIGVEEALAALVAMIDSETRP